MNKNNPYDLVIVGGGIIGMWAAFLASQKNPVLRILVVDQSLIGSGTTHYSLGLNYVYGDTEEKKVLSKLSFEYWENLRTFIPNLAMQAIPFQNINEKNMEAAWLANAEMVTLQMFDFLNKNPNIHFLEGVKIFSFQESNDNVVLKNSLNTQIQTKKVILALGPWVHSFLKEVDPTFILQLNLRTKKIVSFYFNANTKTQNEIIFWPNEPAFLVPDIIHHRIIFSFSSETWDCVPDINQLYIDEQDKNRGFSILEKYHPELISKFSGGRVFCDAYSNVGPIHHGLSHSTKIAIAGAGSGIGFRMAPGIANKTIEQLN